MEAYNPEAPEKVLEKAKQNAKYEFDALVCRSSVFQGVQCHDSF